ncbi:hypothetical protein B0H34DRAFT_132031 [Crassisporium funariophilum]|nr:hypothetical protein B0H34DRAFT_132031 [Crassisporium funariophilum]
MFPLDLLVLSVSIAYGAKAVGVVSQTHPVEYQHIQARNLTSFFLSIPSSCQVDCDVVNGAVRNCEYMSCVCTDTHAAALVQCVNCIVAVSPYTPNLVPSYQVILDEWVYDYCAAFSTPALTVTDPRKGSASPSTSADSSKSTSLATSTKIPNYFRRPVSAFFLLLFVLSPTFGLAFGLPVI